MHSFKAALAEGHGPGPGAAPLEPGGVPLAARGSAGAQCDLQALVLHEVVGRGFGGAVLRASRWGLECAVKVSE